MKLEDSGVSEKFPYSSSNSTLAETAELGYWQAPAHLPPRNLFVVRKPWAFSTLDSFHKYYFDKKMQIYG